MRVKKLIEKLEDLATYLTLAASDAEVKKNESRLGERFTTASIWEGRQIASKHAFEKVDALIKEAKR